MWTRNRRDRFLQAVADGALWTVFFLAAVGIVIWTWRDLVRGWW